MDVLSSDLEGESRHDHCGSMMFSLRLYQVLVSFPLEEKPPCIPRRWTNWDKQKHQGPQTGKTTMWPQSFFESSSFLLLARSQGPSGVGLGSCDRSHLPNLDGLSSWLPCSDILNCFRRSEISSSQQVMFEQPPTEMITYVSGMERMTQRGRICTMETRRFSVERPKV